MNSKMNRRDFLRRAVLGSASLTLAACAPAAPAVQAPAAGEGPAEDGVETTTLVVASFYPLDQTAGWDGLWIVLRKTIQGSPLIHR